MKLHAPAASSVGEERPKEPVSEPIPEPVCREFQKKNLPSSCRKSKKKFPRFSSSSPNRYTAYAAPANRIILKRILQDMAPGGGSENSGSVKEFTNELCY